MNKQSRYLLLLHIAVVMLIFYATFNFLALAVDDTCGDALLTDEISPLSNSGQKELIPRIIHQTYKTEDIPEKWREGQQRCIDLHPEYEYMFWTDMTARDFIAKEYPWFLNTFDSYEYSIERADAIRYFLLFHYGGIYIDLDDGCKRRLDVLLKFPAFVRKTSPVGISNDVMGSVPKHPFFFKVINSLIKYDRNWIIPYITIMYSTGPLFLSVIWKQYKRWGVPSAEAVRILQPADYSLGETSFFTISQGSSWHMGDANFIKLLSNHMLACVVVGFVIGFFGLYIEYCFYCWLTSGSLKALIRSLMKSFHSTYVSLPMHGSNYVAYCTLPNDIKSPGKAKRLRKDSNIPINFVILDLENQGRKLTDLSDQSA